MKDWRKMQPELDRAREVIAQAATDYQTGAVKNPYSYDSPDWASYELGAFDAVIDDLGLGFITEKNRLQTRINELEAENARLGEILKALGGGR